MTINKSRLARLDLVAARAEPNCQTGTASALVMAKASTKYWAAAQGTIFADSKAELLESGTSQSQRNTAMPWASPVNEQHTRTGEPHKEEHPIELNSEQMTNMMAPAMVPMLLTISRSGITLTMCRVRNSVLRLSFRALSSTPVNPRSPIRAHVCKSGKNAVRASWLVNIPYLAPKTLLQAGGCEQLQSWQDRLPTSDPL